MTADGSQGQDGGTGLGLVHLFRVESRDFFPVRHIYTFPIWKQMQSFQLAQLPLQNWEIFVVIFHLILIWTYRLLW